MIKYREWGASCKRSWLYTHFLAKLFHANQFPFIPFKGYSCYFVLNLLILVDHDMVRSRSVVSHSMANPLFYYPFLLFLFFIINFHPFVHITLTIYDRIRCVNPIGGCSSKLTTTIIDHFIVFFLFSVYQFSYEYYFTLNMFDNHCTLNTV